MIIWNAEQSIILLVEVWAMIQMGQFFWSSLRQLRKRNSRRSSIDS